MIREPGYQRVALLPGCVDNCLAGAGHRRLGGHRRRDRLRLDGCRMGSRLRQPARLRHCARHRPYQGRQCREQPRFARPLCRDRRGRRTVSGDRGQSRRRHLQRAPLRRASRPVRHRHGFQCFARCRPGAATTRIRPASGLASAQRARRQRRCRTPATGARSRLRARA